MISLSYQLAHGMSYHVWLLSLSYHIWLLSLGIHFGFPVCAYTYIIYQIMYHIICHVIYVAGCAIHKHTLTLTHTYLYTHTHIHTPVAGSTSISSAYDSVLLKGFLSCESRRIYTQTDRQTGRQTDRQTDRRQTDRQTDRQTHTYLSMTEMLLCDTTVRQGGVWLRREKWKREKWKEKRYTYSQN